MSQTLERPDTTTPAGRAAAWLADFQDALAARDVDRAAGMFAAQSFWRDLIAFTWNIKTVENPDGVADMLNATLDSTDPTNFEFTEEPAEAGGITTGWFSFETGAGRGKGLLRLKEEDGALKAWTFLTALEELKGHEENQDDRRPHGVEHGAFKDRVTWKERKQAEAADLGRAEQPYVVVVGGGQGGIALGARLRQLGVSHVVLDRHPNPGDQWRSRYKTLCLHDPIWYDHLPYLQFPRNWPVFSPKDKIGDWLESYVKVMEVNYWSSTTCRSASYDGDEWTVVVERDGEELTLRPKQLVLATGMSGRPNMPDVPGRDRFPGEVLHSSQFAGPEAYQGKKVVVIGSNNSSFDICGALWEAGAESATMVQRSSTHIVKSETLMDIGLGDLYSERAVAAGVSTWHADMIFASLPYRILHEFQIPAYAAMKERDAEFYDRLERSGFRHDWGDDESGLFMKYLRRGSGYYIDVGAADLVANGDVHLVHGQVTSLTENGVQLENGTELPADLVVFATGYGNMVGWIDELLGTEVGDKVGKVWGLGSDTTKDPGPWEGEQRNMWKPTNQEALWLHGGNLHQSRHYSLPLALQLKARQEGIPTPVYDLQPSHHRS